MNEKIIEVFNEIFSSKDLLSKFMLIDDADELYEFCLSIKNGYSKTEFENFLMQLADECLFQTKSIENETEKIAGGANNFKKFISGNLAALTILTSTGVQAAESNSSSNSNSGYIDLKPLEKEKPPVTKEEEKTFFQKVKEKFKNIGSKIWNNKGKIAAGAAIVAAIIATAICIKNKSNKSNSSKENSGQNENKGEKSHSAFSSVFGLGALGVTSTMLLVDKLANFLDNTSKITKVVKDGTELANKLKTNGEMFGKYLAENEEKSFEEREKEFYDHLKYVRGQDTAVNKLKEIMQEINKTEQIAKEAEKYGKKIPKHPRVIILNGPSGSGKTLCAEMLAKALSPNGKFKKIAAQNIKYDPNSTTSKSTPAEDLFDYHRITYFGESKDNLGKYAANNPNGVAILDEYDKIGLGNGSSAVMKGDVLHPLDATFQSIYDNGCYESPSSDKVSLENFTFILTTNEQNASLGLPQNSNNTSEKTDEELFASFRTKPNHSSHFIDRFKPSVVTFNHLDKEAFKQIAEDDLKTRLDLNMTLDCCGKCNFKIKNDVYDKIAKYIMELKEEASKNPSMAPPSARLIVDYYNGISADVVTKINIFYKERQKKIAENLFKKNGNELKMSIDEIVTKLAFIPGKMTFNIDFESEKNKDGKPVSMFKITCTSLGDYSDNNLENLKKLISNLKL